MMAKVLNERFLAKYLAIQEAFKKKYNEEGKRTGVIYQELEKEFFLSPDRIRAILKMELSEEESEEVTSENKQD